MLAWIVYAFRIVASLVISSVGLLLLSAAINAKQWTIWTVGLSLAIAAAGVIAWPKRPNAWRRDPPTDRQLAYARDLGIHIPAGVSKGELSDLISEATRPL